MRNSSIRRSKGKVGGPGRRSGEGTESLLRYLHEDLETRPHELSDEKRLPKTTLAGRVKAALSKLKDM